MKCAYCGREARGTKEHIISIFYNTVGGVLGGMCYWGIIKIKKGL